MRKVIKGKFFLTFERNEEGHRVKEGGGLVLQGLITDYDPDKNLALVLLFSWDDGMPGGQFLKEVTDNFIFYDTEDEMNEGYIRTLPIIDQEHVRKMMKAERSMV